MKWFLLQSSQFFSWYKPLWWKRMLTFVPSHFPSRKCNCTCLCMSWWSFWRRQANLFIRFVQLRLLSKTTFAISWMTYILSHHHNCHAPTMPFEMRCFWMNGDNASIRSFCCIQILLTRNNKQPKNLYMDLMHKNLRIFRVGIKEHLEDLNMGFFDEFVNLVRFMFAPNNSAYVKIALNVFALIIFNVSLWLSNKQVSTLFALTSSKRMFKNGLKILTLSVNPSRE